MASSSARSSAHGSRGSWRAALLGIALVLASTACRRTSPSSSDGDGGKDRDRPTRIVSLSPSTTEALFAIGAGQDVVGRSRYCNVPAEVASLPQVGGYIDPNFEAILALRPTLVTGARGPAGDSLTRKLEARGIAVYFPPTESFEGIDAMLLGLGQKTSHGDEARALVDSLHDDLAHVDAALEGRPRPRVLVVFGLNPLSVAGPASFANEMIVHAGGQNVVTEGGTYPTLGVERVLSLDPDIILNASMAEAGGKPRMTRETPGFHDVRAVREDHVVSVDEESVLRPGPRIAEGVRVLAKALHPDIDFMPKNKPREATRASTDRGGATMHDASP